MITRCFAIFLAAGLLAGCGKTKEQCHNLKLVLTRVQQDYSALRDASVAKDRAGFDQAKGKLLATLPQLKELELPDGDGDTERRLRKARSSTVEALSPALAANDARLTGMDPLEWQKQYGAKDNDMLLGISLGTMECR